MFIAHGEKVRKHSRWILGGILILLIPGFIALFTTTGGRERKADDLPTLRGKPLNAAEFETAKQSVRDQYVISSGRQLPRSPEVEDAVTREAVLRILLQRQAHTLGIRVPDEVLLAQIRSLPIFANESGQFDGERYRRFMIFLNNHGISEPRFEQLMREQALIGQLQAMVADTAKVTPTEVELNYAPLHERLFIDLVRFDVADSVEKPVISEADAKAFFEQQQAQFRKPAQVKVRYAVFSFDEAKKTAKVSDAEVSEYYEQNQARYIRLDTNTAAVVTNSLDQVKDEIRDTLLLTAAQRQAGEQAERFAVKLVPEAGAPRPDFAKLAGEVGAKVAETGYFAQNDTIPGVDGSRAFIQAAFALSYRPEPPFSDPVPGADGYYVLEYLDGKPSRLPAFDEVKAEVVERLQKQRVYEATVSKAREALDKVRQSVNASNAFTTACAELKLVAEAHGPFTLADEKLDLPAAPRIQQAALGMTTNSISELIPTASGAVFFNLKDRQPFDRAEFEKDKAAFTQQLLQRNRQAMFESWLGKLWQDEQVTLGKLRSRPAAPEAEPEESTEPQPAPPPPAS